MLTNIKTHNRWLLALLIPLMILTLIVPGAESVFASKGHADLQSVNVHGRIQQPGRWGMTSHGRYYANNFKITGIAADTAKGGKYVFCMQPGLQGPWIYGSKGKRYSIDHQYGPYQELPNTWDELYNVDENGHKTESQTQKNFKGKSTKDINGNEQNRMSLIARYICYYGPGGPGYKKGYTNPTNHKTFKAGKEWSCATGGLSHDYDVWHILAAIWRADYKDGGSDCISWGACKSSISEGPYAGFGDGSYAHTIYNMYRSYFYDDGGDKVDFDRLYDGVPNTYIVGYVVVSGMQDFMVPFNSGQIERSLSVTKESKSVKALTGDDAEDIIDDIADITDDKISKQQALKDLKDFLAENTLYTLKGTQIQASGDTVKDSPNKKTVDSESFNIEWEYDDELKAQDGVIKVKEVKASKGYKLNTTEYEKNVKVGDHVDFTMYNDPINVPLGIKLFKTQADSDNPALKNGSQKSFDLSGAEFKVEYKEYTGKNLNNADDKSTKATFYVKSKKDGSIPLTKENIEFKSDASAKYLATFMATDGLPLGTYKITEVKAPEGFKKDSNPHYVVFNDNDEYTDNSKRRIEIYQSYTKRGQLQNSFREVGSLKLNDKAADYTEIFKNSKTTISDEEGSVYSITLQKRDNDTWKKVGQGNAELSDRTFQVKLVKGSHWVMKDQSGNGLFDDEVYEVNAGDIVYIGNTDENGVFTVPKDIMWAGAEEDSIVYEITEVDKHKNGYYNNNNWKATVSYSQHDIKTGVIGQNEIIQLTPADGVLADNAKDHVKITSDSVGTKGVEEEVWRAGVKFKKVDNELYREKDPQGDATLEGAEFTVWNISKRSIMTRNVHYLSDPTPTVDWSKLVTGRNDDHTKEIEPVSLTEARNGSTNGVVGVLKTDKDGFTSSLKNDLPYGEYFIKETKPSQGYKLDTVWFAKIKIEKDGCWVMEGPTSEYKQVATYSRDYMFNLDNYKVEEPVIRGGYRLHKDDNDLDDQGMEGEHKPQGDATLAGAEFTIVNKSAQSVVVRDVPYLSDTTPKADWTIHPGPKTDGVKEVEPGEVVGIMRTDENGYSETLKDDLPYGTYYITETKASEGYLIDDTWFDEIVVREDGTIYEKTYHRKSNDEAGGCVQEKVKRGGFILQKWDKELNRSEALGGKDHDASKHEGTDLNNIKFTVKNVSNHSVVVPKDIDASIKDSKAPLDIDYSIKPGKYTDERLQEVASGKEIGIVTTNWSEKEQAYVAFCQTDALPYGTYEIWESRNNRYYELTDKHVATIKVREDGSIYTVRHDDEWNIFAEERLGGLPENTKTPDYDYGDQLVWKDYVWRQGVEFTKIGDSNSKRFGYVPFKITNLTTGEYHYVITDKDGYFNSEKFPHSRNTNAYDEYIDGHLQNNEVIKVDDLKNMRVSEDGVDVTAPGNWFFLGEDKTQAPVNDKKACLPYGAYQITEVPCDLNEGYTMQDFKFWVNTDEDKTWSTEYKPVNLDTITNDKIELKTNATCGETESQEGSVSKETTIIDKVSYKGLIVGKEYTVSGILMKQIVGEDGNITGEPLLIDGKEVTASETFKAEQSDGTIDLVYTLDSRSLAGTTTVVFEDLYEEGVKVASHADIGDKAQSVWFPEIKTLAMDKITNSHMLIASDNATIIDTVTYKALTKGKKYTLEGVLMKVTGEGENMKAVPMLDKNGNEITANHTFVAPATDGTVEMEFTFDASDVEGAKTVVYETLIRNHEVVATHSDPTDEGQTIYFPSIRTTAVDNENGTHTAKAGENVTIKDTVDYKGLIPGEEYTLKGVLMDKDANTSLDVTAELKFKPENVDGSVDILFNLDSTALAGKNTVVFEELWWGDTLVTEHKDITDEGQSINFAKIGTSAKDAKSETHIALGEREMTIIDTVNYQGLTPGQEYTVQGELYDKTSGGTLNVKSEPVTFTPEAPEGQVEITFNFDGSTFTGQTLVAFEELYVNGALVAEHKDINDEEQSIHVPELKTNAKDAKTGKSKAEADKDTQIIDTVDYTNLIPGKEYIVKGRIYDATDKKETDIVGETTFTPKKADGKTKVTFTFDGTKYAGHTLVVFEELYYEGNLVAEHKDKNDESQTVYINKVKETKKSTTGSSSSSKTEGTPGVGTGDSTGFGTLLAVLILAAIATSAGVVYSRRKKIADVSDNE